MKQYYIDSIGKHRSNHRSLYDEAVEDVFGEQVPWSEVQGHDRKELIQLMCVLDDKVKLHKSPIDVRKLAHAIQHSRSGIGGCAMTSYRCSFCGKEEMWGNTAVPHICGECSTKMAKNIAKFHPDILKRGE